MITVWGRATSSNVQPVMWALAELGLAAERIDAGGAFGGLDTPEFVAMNPNRLIPVLRDRDVTIFESAAIVRYLGAAYGKAPFWPADPLQRAPLDMWAEWIKTTFGPLFTGSVFLPIVRVKPADRNLATIEKGTADLAKLAAILDQRIGAGPWLAGEAFTFADIIVGSLLYRYFTLEIERSATPSLEAYYHRLTDRPTYATHVMVSYESLRPK